MIEIICNDRFGKKVSVKCNKDDTIGDLKKLEIDSSFPNYILENKDKLKKWII